MAFTALYEIPSISLVPPCSTWLVAWAQLWQKSGDDSLTVTILALRRNCVADEHFISRTAPWVFVFVCTDVVRATYRLDLIPPRFSKTTQSRLIVLAPAPWADLSFSRWNPNYSSTTMLPVISHCYIAFYYTFTVGPFTVRFQGLPHEP